MTRRRLLDISVVNAVKDPLALQIAMKHKASGIFSLKFKLASICTIVGHLLRSLGFHQSGNSGR
jgi:hypothetical protein